MHLPICSLVNTKKVEDNKGDEGKQVKLGKKERKRNAEGEKVGERVCKLEGKQEK